VQPSDTDEFAYSKQHCLWRMMIKACKRLCCNCYLFLQWMRERLLAKSLRGPPAAVNSLSHSS
jgi:hypothetical protein